MTLGASVVEHDVLLGSTARRLPPAQSHPQNRVASPSLIRTLCQGAGASRVLLSYDDSDGNADGSVHTIVDSLTMDLALSLASNQPCRCQLHRADRCDCVAVVIFKPAVEPEHDAFPFLCHGSGESPFDKEDTNSNLETTEENVVSAQRQRQKSTPSPSEPSRIQQRALQRVQIRRVTNVNDIWHYLLLVCGLPANQHPVGGILLQGLDRLGGAVDAATMVRQTQTVALMVDTAHCLQRWHGSRTAPLVVVTRHEPGSAELRQNRLSLVSSFWSPLLLHVRRNGSGRNDGRNGPAHECMVTTPDATSCGTVSVVEHWENGEPYIVWTAK